MTGKHRPTPAANAVRPESWNVPGDRYRGVALATIPQRIVAGFIDYLLVAGVPARAIDSVFVGVGGWVFVGLALLNSGYMVERTGQSFGKRLLGLQTFRETTQNGQPTAVFLDGGLGMIRVLLHALDLIGLLGFIRAAFHYQHRTWADSITHSVTVREKLALVRENYAAIVAVEQDDDEGWL